MAKINSSSDAELRQLALDIADGVVFTDRHINDISLLGSVFMPLLFIEDFDKMDDVGMIYERMSKANHMSINSYPIFMSFKTINKEDTKKVMEYYEEIMDIKI